MTAISPSWPRYRPALGLISFWASRIFRMRLGFAAEQLSQHVPAGIAVEPDNPVLIFPAEERVVRGNLGQDRPYLVLDLMAEDLLADDGLGDGPLVAVPRILPAAQPVFAQLVLVQLGLALGAQLLRGGQEMAEAQLRRLFGAIDEGILFIAPNTPPACGDAFRREGRQEPGLSLGQLLVFLADGKPRAEVPVPPPALDLEDCVPDLGLGRSGTANSALAARLRSAISGSSSSMPCWWNNCFFKSYKLAVTAAALPLSEPPPCPEVLRPALPMPRQAGAPSPRPNGRAVPGDPACTSSRWGARRRARRRSRATLCPPYPSSSAARATARGSGGGCSKTRSAACGACRSIPRPSAADDADRLQPRQEAAVLVVDGDHAPTRSW